MGLEVLGVSVQGAQGRVFAGVIWGSPHTVTSVCTWSRWSDPHQRPVPPLPLPCSPAGPSRWALLSVLRARPSSFPGPHSSPHCAWMSQPHRGCRETDQVPQAAYFSDLAVGGRGGV